MSKRVWIGLGGGASISALIAILAWASINTGGNPGGLAVNSDLIEFEVDTGSARDFELDLVGGGVLKLSELRGKIMMQDGEFLGDRKDGKFLKRKVDESIRNRPVI